MASGARLCIALALAGCAQVLGIPPDPELSEPIVPGAPDAGSIEVDVDASVGSVPEPDVGSTPGTSNGDGVGSDNVLPPGSVGGISGSTQQPVAGGGPDASAPAPLEPIDAGVPADAGSDALPCEGLLGRVPTDLILVVDNSGSMAAETAAFEAALPGFVARLDDDSVDYRIILITRHREEARSASEEASTSVCVAAPVSGLSACPGPRPVPAERFFPYSIKIDANDSFERILESLTAPDRFALTERGWVEWLRPEALKIFIEITDADSSMSVADFLAQLSVASPEFFPPPPAPPSFVFHSILGIAQKPLVPDIYSADEPIETGVCSGEGTTPDDAGVVYQELSRETGGLRLSICPLDAMSGRLAALATDVALRSVRVCPPD
jgi:hypothetical protein